MRTAALFAAITLLTACGDDGPSGPLGAGTFQMQVTGAVTASPSGFAWFGLAGPAGGQRFALLLTDAAGDHVVIASYDGTSRPPTGTYPISPDDWDVMYVRSSNNEVVATFFALDGEITITESAARRLSGTITFDATGDMNGTEQDVSATVTFDARPAS